MQVPPSIWQNRKENDVSHTPGPWFVVEGENTGCLTVGCEAGTISVLENVPLQGISDRDNAPLIAAAPALLAACKAVLRSLPVQWHTNPANTRVRDQACDAIALAKPKGE